MRRLYDSATLSCARPSRRSIPRPHSQKPGKGQLPKLLETRLLPRKVGNPDTGPNLFVQVATSVHNTTRHKCIAVFRRVHERGTPRRQRREEERMGKGDSRTASPRAVASGAYPPGAHQHRGSRRGPISLACDGSSQRPTMTIASAHKQNQRQPGLDRPALPFLACAHTTCRVDGLAAGCDRPSPDPSPDERRVTPAARLCTRVANRSQAGSLSTHLNSVCCPRQAERATMDGTRRSPN
jgi:hypothetical protein